MKKRVCTLLLSLLLATVCLIGCGQAPDPSLQALNQALEAANNASGGTLQLSYVEQGEAYPAETIEYTLEGKSAAFTREEYETEGSSNLYKYQDEVLYREIADSPGKFEVYDSRIRYQTLSEIAGVNLAPLEQKDINSISTSQQDSLTVYTVTVPQDALLLASDDEQTPIVIDALTKRFYVNEAGILQKVDYDFSSTIEMTLRVEFS